MRTIQSHGEIYAQRCDASVVTYSGENIEATSLLVFRHTKLTQVTFEINSEWIKFVRNGTVRKKILMKITNVNSKHTHSMHPCSNVHFTCQVFGFYLDRV